MVERALEQSEKRSTDVATKIRRNHRFRSYIISICSMGYRKTHAAVSLGLHSENGDEDLLIVSLGKHPEEGGDITLRNVTSYKTARRQN
jgi:hypothetical protein